MTLPADGDALNAASVAQGYKVLADFVAWLTNHGVWRDLATVVTVGFSLTGKILAEGDGSDDEPAMQTLTAPTVRRQLWKINTGNSTGSNVYVRLYHSAANGYEITINAKWDSAGAEWDRDDTGEASTRYRQANANGSWAFQYRVAGASFGDGSWVDNLALDSDGNLTVATALKGKHLIGTSSTPSVVANAPAGTGRSATVTGNDIGGKVQLTTGTGVSAGDYLTVTFATTMASAPKAVIVTPLDSAAINLVNGANSTIPLVTSIATTGWRLTNSSATVLADSTTYTWQYVVIG